ncbi:DUF6164 family protein [Aidingimonas halophila]|uniref:DUF2007 domain-containing protein n=1 Tax=Aidingimonas halophila TaxID=574349 RepID=A0A1H2TXB4_9GAMM|nr:DUF6164 family protein [Aidingimonas halophila]GHC38652.1 hypothetical protein GCM10008094_35100 [Aidingimonas halophila]SDW48562.1 hypothetical protein SAMN05443545_10217 [Aidingimonas halophila]
MAVLLFKLRNVPDEEAEAVRRLLDEHGFDTYETTAGRWQLSLPAIWLQDESQYEAARQVIDAYQQELGQRVRDEYADLQARGEAPTLWQRLRDNPLTALLYLAAIGVILTLTLWPFLSLI